MSEIRDRWDIIVIRNGKEAIVGTTGPSGYVGHKTAQEAIDKALSLPWLKNDRWAVARGDLSEIAHRHEPSA